MKTILLSGFEPFDGMSDNASEKLISSLENVRLKKVKIETIILPVSFERSYQELELAILKYHPDIVISFGVSRKRECVGLEKIAINWADGKLKDNDGVQMNCKKIVSSGPDGIFSTLPIEKIKSKVFESDQDVAISFSAETYVCNSLMYKTLYKLRDQDIDYGFIHLPDGPIGPVKLKVEKLLNFLA